MSYKHAILQDESVEKAVDTTKHDDYVTWEEADKHIQCLMSSQVPLKKITDAQYEVICENDGLVYDCIDELKERYEFEGFPTNVNVHTLIDIYIANMRLEEYQNVEEDEDDDEESHVLS